MQNKANGLNLDQKFRIRKPPPKEPYESAILNMFQYGKAIGYRDIVRETPVSLSQAARVCAKFKRNKLIEEV